MYAYLDVYNVQYTIHIPIMSGDYVSSPHLWELGQDGSSWDWATQDGEVYLICSLCIRYMGHSGEYGNGAKLVGKISKSVMQLISIHF